MAATLWNLPLVRTPKLDSAEYLSWGQRLASGDWSWPVVAQHGPGYPLVLASLLAIGSGSLKFAIVVQALAGAATAVLLALVAKQWFGERAGLAAGLIYAVYGPAVYIDTALLAEGLLLFLLALALWQLSGDAIGLTRAAVAGALFGAAALVRPTALLVAAPCAVWLLMAKRRSLAAVFAGACVAVLLPAVAKNLATSGSPSIQGYGGLNVYIGDSPLHDGRATFRLGGGWDALNAEAARAGIADAGAQDRYYLRKTWREIAAHPGAFLTLLASKSLWLVQAEESRDSHSYYFFTEQSWLLRALPHWAVLFPLACVGFVAAANSDGARRCSGASLLLWFTLGASLSVVLLVVGFRYRMPLVPALTVAAGAGVAAIVTALSSRHRRDLVVYGATLAAAVIVSHVRGDARNRNTAEEWAFTGSSLVTERQLEAAEAAYRRAIELDPQSGLAWDGLALTLYNGGKLDEARKAVTRAIEIDSESARAIFHRALIDEREEHVAQAADGYARALELSPHDDDIMRHFGEARRRLAVGMAMAGRTREARDAMRTVVGLLPANGEAWLDYCLLSLDVGDTAAASDALQRARSLGAEPERLAFAEQALARQQ